MQILKDYLSKVNANVHQVGGHTGQITAQKKMQVTTWHLKWVQIVLQIEASNKGQISNHPSGKGLLNDQQICLSEWALSVSDSKLEDKGSAEPGRHNHSSKLEINGFQTKSFHPSLQGIIQF